MKKRRSADDGKSGRYEQTHSSSEQNKEAEMTADLRKLPSVCVQGRKTFFSY